MCVSFCVSYYRFLIGWSDSEESAVLIIACIKQRTSWGGLLLQCDIRIVALFIHPQYYILQVMYCNSVTSSTTLYHILVIRYIRTSQFVSCVHFTKITIYCVMPKDIGLCRPRQ